MTKAQDWQLVFLLWGEKYGVDEVNQLIEGVIRNGHPPARITMISDRPRPGLLPEVTLCPMPEFFKNPVLQGPGCQAKLAIFEEGILPTDMPAIFLDIDTMVLGDLSKVLDLLETPETVAMIQSAIVPFGPIGRALYRWSDGKRYARGNSSVVAFHPAHCHYVAARFRELFREYNGLNYRPMIADERFISWATQPYVRAIPRNMVVKFPTEFMMPWRWLNYVRGAMPWKRRQWAGLIAVTFPGLDLKGQKLAEMPEGNELTDRKGRVLVWSNRTIGPLRAKIIAHYAAMQSGK